MILIAGDDKSKQVRQGRMMVDWEKLFKADSYPAKTVPLDFGDFAFSGNGPGDSTVMVGVERKTIPDLISSMRSGRLTSHQIPGMIETYDYSFLLVEGIYRAKQDGSMEVYEDGQWRVTYNSVEYVQVSHFLQSISIMSPVRVVHSHNPKGTVRAVEDLFSWFHKTWDTHKSFQHFYTSPPPAIIAVSKPDADTNPREWRRWVLRHVAKELPGIGWERSAAVADRFVTVKNMTMATKEDWAGIDGVGKITAAKVTYALGSNLVDDVVEIFHKLTPKKKRKE